MHESRASNGNSLEETYQYKDTLFCTVKYLRQRIHVVVTVDVPKRYLSIRIGSIDENIPFNSVV
jgi:hypothetical protein